MASLTPAEKLQVDAAVAGLLHLARPAQGTVRLTFDQHRQYSLKLDGETPAVVALGALREPANAISIVGAPSGPGAEEPGAAELTPLHCSGKNITKGATDHSGYVRFTAEPGNVAEFPLHGSGRAVIITLASLEAQLRIEHPCTPLAPKPLATRGGGQNGSWRLKLYEELLDEHFPTAEDGTRKFPVMEKAVQWVETVIKVGTNSICLTCGHIDNIALLSSIHPLPGNVLCFSTEHQRLARLGHQQYVLEHAKPQRQPKLGRTPAEQWKDVTKMLLDLGFRAANKSERTHADLKPYDTAYRVFVFDTGVWNKKGHRSGVRPNLTEKRIKSPLQVQEQVHDAPTAAETARVTLVCESAINKLLRAAGRPTLPPK